MMFLHKLKSWVRWNLAALKISAAWATKTVRSWLYGCKQLVLILDQIPVKTSILLNLSLLCTFILGSLTKELCPKKQTRSICLSYVTLIETLSLYGLHKLVPWMGISAYTGSSICSTGLLQHQKQWSIGIIIEINTFITFRVKDVYWCLNYRFVLRSS